MADTIDDIMFDLSEVLPEEHIAELVERVRLANELATVEAILRMSFKAPDGGAKFRQRVFDANIERRQRR